MYYPYFLAYMLAGFGLSLLVLLWALNSGQFKDQQRARFLPLQGEGTAKPVRTATVNRMNPKSRIEFYALFALVAIGLLLTASVLGFAVIRSAGGPNAPF